MNQTIVWLIAIVLGAFLGMLDIQWLHQGVNFTATVFTRLFQFVAVPTIALAVITTLAKLGSGEQSGHIFRRTITYTLLTTLASALVGLTLYVIVAPESLPIQLLGNASADELPSTQMSYTEHLLGVVPDNIVTPFASGNVLAVLLVSAAVGLILARMPQGDERNVLLKLFGGLQTVFHTLIRGLIRILPLGIVAFAAQLSAQLSAGTMMGSLGKYVAVILGGNVLQMIVVLPLFLWIRGINPLRVLRAMSPAVVMAFFTKSSAATLPVTIDSAEKRLGVDERVSRFVLPICTTINMNGCAAFILVTSLFVMQHSQPITLPMMLVWIFVAVFAAVGNAGVPMGCYFLTLSLMTSQPYSAAIMGIILPLFAMVDMVETAENVWSDSCVCTMTNKDFQTHLNNNNEETNNSHTASL